MTYHFGTHEWVALMECDDCREETDHEFVTKAGRTVATCTVCEFVSEVEE